MNDLTDEQVRRIEAAVAECMGYQWAKPTGSWVLYPPGSLKGSNIEVFAAPDSSLDDVAYVNVPRFASDYGDWGKVEGWMVESFSRENKFEYHIALRASVEHPIGEVLTVFAMMTAPLPLRCMAFLGAMGKDVDAILRGEAKQIA